MAPGPSVSTGDWTYTHKGQVAPNEDKYIITGWFDYLDDTEPV